MLLFSRKAWWNSFNTPTRSSWYKAGELPGPAGCPLQTMGEDLDENGEPSGKPIHETVQEYADNLDIWLEDFVNVWEKMSQNGNSNLIDGPKDIMTSGCCIHSSVKYSGGKTLKAFKADNTIACQEECKQKQKCNWFVFNSRWTWCTLYDAKPETAKYASNNWLGGPPTCPENENSCNAYKSI